MRFNFPEGASIASRIATSILFKAINLFDDSNSTITTYRIKSLKNSLQSTRTNPTDTYNLKKIGIVIQGPLIPKITVRICERYRSLYPETAIIFSTWPNQNLNDLSDIQSLGIHILENLPPNYSGPGNINLQIISTLSGIKYCQSIGSEYVLKNRSDVFLSSDTFLEYLVTMYLSFSHSKNRIVIPAYNSFLFRPYSPTDQIQFGKLKDLEIFWGSPLVSIDTQDFQFSESYLVRNYLSRIDRKIKNSIADSLMVLRDFFIIADNENLGLIFNKGTKFDVSNRWGAEGFPHITSQINFWNWIDLSKNLQTYVDLYEELHKETESEITNCTRKEWHK